MRESSERVGRVSATGGNSRLQRAPIHGISGQAKATVLIQVLNDRAGAQATIATHVDDNGGAGAKSGGTSRPGIARN